jgi:hypothetical protein
MGKIIVSRCDSCGATHTHVVLNFKANGQSHSLCRGCDPGGFEVQARQDIDAWLRGDPDADSRIGL